MNELTTSHGCKTYKMTQYNTFDKLTIVSHISTISDIDTNIFEKRMIKDLVYSYQYRQTSPYDLVIRTNTEKEEVVIEFTGKILGERYTELITYDNIGLCFDNINELGVCKLDADRIINEGEVVKCDSTIDVHTSDISISQLEQTFKLEISNPRKWNVRPYNWGDGIVVNNNVKTPSCKNRLSLYNKGKEMKHERNKSFLNSIDNADEMLSYYEDVIRFELNINTEKQIRDYLGIDYNGVTKVLSSCQNSIYHVIDKVIKPFNPTPVYAITTFKEKEREAMLKYCDYDLTKVAEVIKSFTSKGQSITRKLEPYRKLMSKINTIDVSNIDIRGLLRESSNF